VAAIFAARRADGPLADKDQALVGAMWEAAYSYEDARKDLLNSLDYLARDVAELQRYVSDGRIYSSCNIASKGADVAVAHAKLHVAMKLAGSLANALGLRYEALYNEADNTAWREWRETAVVRMPGIITVECADEIALRRSIAESSGLPAAEQTAITLFAAGWRLMRDGLTFCTLLDGAFGFVDLQKGVWGTREPQPVNYRDEASAWLAHKALPR